MNDAFSAKATVKSRAAPAAPKPYAVSKRNPNRNINKANVAATADFIETLGLLLCETTMLHGHPTTLSELKMHAHLLHRIHSHIAADITYLENSSDHEDYQAKRKEVLAKIMNRAAACLLVTSSLYHMAPVETASSSFAVELQNVLADMYSNSEAFNARNKKMIEEEQRLAEQAFNE